MAAGIVSMTSSYHQNDALTAHSRDKSHLSVTTSSSSSQLAVSNSSPGNQSSPSAKCSKRKENSFERIAYQEGENGDVNQDNKYHYDTGNLNGHFQSGQSIYNGQKFGYVEDELLRRSSE